MAKKVYLNSIVSKIRLIRKLMKKLVLLSIGIVALVTSASAQYTTNVLFTTANDWSEWAGNSPSSVAVDSSFSSDNNTINGLGNTGAGTGTGNGSLAITLAASGYTEIANHVATEGGNSAFLSALDPGSSGNTAVAYNGIIQMTYSLPSYYASGSYFQLGIFLQYDGDGYYGPNLWSSTTDLGYTDPNGNEMYQATIPYTINAGVFNGMGFGVFLNSDYSGLAFPIYVDQITSLTPTPEPGTMALCELGALGFTFIARRRRA
jgi:hypothetical protein